MLILFSIDKYYQLHKQPVSTLILIKLSAVFDNMSYVITNNVYNESLLLVLHCENSFSYFCYIL